MPGRPDFTTPGSGGSGQTVSVNERPELDVVEITNTSTVDSGTVNDTEIYAPTGSIYTARALNVFIEADPDATSGNHRVRIRPFGSFDVLYGDSSHSDPIYFRRGFWDSATNIANPPSAAAQQSAVQALKATENSPIRFRYENDTDVNRTEDRVFKLVVEEVSY